MRIAFATIAAMLVAPMSWATEGYICVAEKATGFKAEMSAGPWKESNFKTDERYIVVRSPLPKFKWAVKQPGMETPLAWCKADFDQYGYLLCDGAEEQFRMNRKDLRFQTYYYVGYVGSGAGGPTANEKRVETPLIEIGRCTSL